MAVDIATLGIQIDLLNAQEATALLDKLRNAVNRASNAGQNLTQQGRDITRTLVTVQRSTGSVTSALAQATQRLLGFRSAGHQVGTEMVYIDDQLQIVGRSVARTAAAFNTIVNPSTTNQLRRLGSIFEDAGVAINATTRQTEELTRRMQRVSRDRAFQDLARDANLSSIQVARLRVQMGDFGGAVRTIGSAFAQHKIAITAAVTSMVLFGKACLDAQVEMQRLDMAYSAVFGSAAQAQLRKVYEQADRVGLKFMDAAQAAKGFFAAGKGTALEKDLQNIFKAITDSGAALQLSTDEVNGALVALGQMISKGKVQAEELRGQLGERLPGAFSLAAKAMGMTTAELDKFMADGKLTAEDLLPKLAAALEEKYGAAAERAADTVQGSINRMENEWTRFKARIMNSGPVVFAVKFVTEYLQRGNEEAAIEAERADLIKSLEEQGVEKLGVAAPSSDYWTSMISSIKGATKEEKVYTEQQLENERIQRRQLALVKQIEEEEVRRNEKALAERRSLIDEINKGDKEYKKAKETSELQEKINALTSHSNELRKKGSALSKIESEQIAENEKAIASAQKQIKELAEAENKKGKSGAAAAKSAAVAQADYTGELERTRNSIDSLQQQLGLDKTESITQQKIKIEEKYQQAISKTNEALAKQVAQKRLTQQQADTLKTEKEKEASLQKQLSLKQLEQKQEQKNVQITQGQIKFYKELGQLSGNYGNSIELQNQLIQKQAKEYQEVYGISGELVDQWVRLQELQTSQNPFDGAYRGLLKFNAEYSDSAKQWESISYNFGKNFMSTTRSMFDDFIDTGKSSFDSLKNLFKQLLKDLAWQAIAQPIVLSIIGGVTGGMLGGGGTAQAGTVGVQAGTGGGAAGSDITGMVNQAASLGGKYAINQLMGGSGGFMAGITSSINSSVASMFPSLFAANQSLAIGNQTINAANAVVAKLGTGGAASALPTTTFTSALGTAGIGAGIGAIASPFVNNLLGLQNNTGSQVGSLLGGGLGTLGGALVAASAIPGAGWIGGGIAALGALLGGGFGSLFGGQKKKVPSMGFSFQADLWKPWVDAIEETHEGTFNRLTSGGNAYIAESETHGGAQGGIGMAEDAMNAIKAISQQSWAIADALGEVDKSLKSDYLKGLESAGRIYTWSGVMKGEGITSENVEAIFDQFAQDAQKAMVEALGTINLTPLTKAADGFAARTVDDMAASFGKIFSFVNTGMSIEDEDLRTEFTTQAISQMEYALKNVSFAPLSKAADGFAVDTLDELATSLENVFSLYDLSENLQDESAKKAFQQWAQTQIERAFTGVDLSFLRVDFDKESFGGLQQAYAATQAWKAVNESIKAVVDPLSEFDTAMNEASLQFTGWISNLRQLGWQEEAIAEIEAKRASYMAEYQRQLQSEMQQNLSLRLTSLARGSNSWQYGLQSLRYQQANELDEIRQKFGENSGIYRTTKAAQSAETTQYALDYLKQQREQAAQKQLQVEQARVQAEQQAIQERQQLLQEEISAKRSEMNAIKQTVSSFQRLTESLEKFRRELWTGQNNLMGSRYNDAYSQFNSLYERALSGDEEAYNELTSKATDLLQLGREQLPERGEYDALFYEVDQKLKNAHYTAEKQLTEAERQLEALESQLEAMEAQQESLNAELESLNTQTEVLGAQLEQEELSNLNLEQIDKSIASLTQIMQYQTAQLANAYKKTFSYDFEGLYSKVVTERNRTGYAGRYDWSRSDILEEIEEKGLTPAQWYQQVARIQGFTLDAAKTTNDVIDHEIGLLDRSLSKGLLQQSDLLNGTLTDQFEQALLEGADINSLLSTQIENWPLALEAIDGVSTDITGAIDSLEDSIYAAIAAASKSSSSSSGGSSSGHVSGTSTSSTGKTTSITDSWSQSILKAPSATNIKEVNTGTAHGYTTTMKVGDLMSILSGKKFAKGGITPSDELFMVGEEGPELMISSDRYGVLNTQATRALLNKENPRLAIAITRADPAEDAELAAIREVLTSILAFMKQNVVKSDETAFLMRQIRDLFRNWDVEGLPREASI